MMDNREFAKRVITIIIAVLQLILSFL